MGETSTKIIRDYIDTNLREFDRTLLENKYLGKLDNRNLLSEAWLLNALKYVV